MKKSAFSLVELLITITLVSLIIGVTAPVFTKKLHANSTIVGASESENEPKFDCTGEDFYLLKKEDSGLEYDLCITKYNMLTADTEMAMADDAITSAGVTFVAAGESCDASTSACFWGKGNALTSGIETASTEGSYPCTEKNGYSGCYRTTCNWNAGVSLCSNYNYGNKTWRLPTLNELTKFNDADVSQLNLCDFVYDSVYARCYIALGQCSGSNSNNCYPGSNWSNTVSGSTISYYDLNYNVWNGPKNGTQTSAYSVRCATPMIEDGQKDCTAFGEDCTDCDEEKCLACSNTCEDGQVADVNSNCECKSCSEIYGDGCNSCDNTGCTSCDSGYTLEDGECKYVCSGSNCYTTIGNLYVTTMNMGDSSYLPIPSTVNVVSAGETCDSTNNKCCWQGTTANPETCTSKNGYSGCTRTVCDWDAGNEICSKLTLDGFSWRLPTNDELAGFSTEEIRNSLNFCDGNNNYSGTTYARCTPGESGTYCPGGYSNTPCNSYIIWSATAYLENVYSYYQLSNNNWSSSQWYTTMPFSVRCVACTTICSSGQYADDTCSCTACSSKYGDGCDSCNGNYCLQCKDGYGPTKDASGNITSCTACTTANCLRCASGPSTCSQCEDGYYLDGTSCKKCSNTMTNCTKCSNATTCTQCINNGYFLTGVSGYECMPCASSSKYGPGCAACNETECTNCPTGNFMSGTQCIPCSSIDSNCEECTSQGCSVCKSGYYVNSSKKCSSCSSAITGCSTCSSSSVCTTCQSGYDKSGNSCVATATCSDGEYQCGSGCCSCPSNCSYCSSSSTCTGCDYGYYLSGGSCYSCSSAMTGCSSCYNSSACVSCNNGYYVNSSGTCSSCSSAMAGCTSCSSATYCNTCQSSYYYRTSSGTCSACPANCYVCPNGSCTVCTGAYYLSGGSCLSCASAMTGCSSCNSSSYCLSCKTGYTQSGGKCVAN